MRDAAAGRRSLAWYSGWTLSCRDQSDGKREFHMTGQLNLSTGLSTSLVRSEHVKNGNFFP